MREKEEERKRKERKKGKKGGREEKEKGKEEQLCFRDPSKEKNQVWILRLPFISPVMLSKMCTPLPRL